MKKEEFLKTMTDQIRCRMARNAVREEYSAHIEDQIQDFINSGMEREEAEEAAVLEMGDPVENGNEMNRIHRPVMPWAMIVLIAVLSIAGYLFQLSMQIKMVQAGGDSWMETGRNLCFIAVGMAVMMGVCFADYTRIARHARLLMVLFDLMMILAVPLNCMQVNGRNGYIVLPVIGYITVEYVLFLAVPLFAAVLYSYRGQGYVAIVKGGLWMLIPAAAAWNIPRITTAWILLVSCMGVLALAVWKDWFTVKKKRVLAGIAACVAGMPAAVIAYLWIFGLPYQQERLRVILSPAGTESAYSRLYVVNQFLDGSRIAGAGADTQDILRIPGISDYMLTGVVAYYGILAGILVFGVLLFLLFRLLKVSLVQKNQLGMLMGAACAFLLLIETVLYIAVNLGALNSAAFCPFFTYGGTGTLVTYVLLGLMLSICRYSKTAPERETVSVRLFPGRRESE